MSPLLEEKIIKFMDNMREAFCLILPITLFVITDHFYWVIGWFILYLIDRVVAANKITRENVESNGGNDQSVKIDQPPPV